MKTEKIYTQHEENKEWKNSLLFYRDEIKIMKGRLAEVASKNTSKEIMKQVERFQNQLIIQIDTVDRIRHEINLSNDAIYAEIRKNETAVDHREINDHSVIRDNISAFEKNFNTLRAEFIDFVGRWI
jgi:hypothetical protein